MTDTRLPLLRCPRCDASGYLAGGLPFWTSLAFDPAARCETCPDCQGTGRLGVIPLPLRAVVPS